MTPGWVFCCPVRIWSPAALQSLFDITGNLTTPVSAFMELAAVEPRFLLESVEGGERLARYSFIGFGDALEVRLDGAGLAIGAQRHPLPRSGGELLAGLRTALRLAPKPAPDIAGVPLAGGLVGYAAYDVVRYFERLPARAAGASGVPALPYVAPRSGLGFGHLTRGIALLHARSEAERRSLRQEVVRALRGALPNGRRHGRYAPPTTAYARADYMAGVRSEEHTSELQSLAYIVCRLLLE